MAASFIPALLAAAILLTGGPPHASAHSAGPPEDVEARVIGREHARQHARIWRAITRAQKRWQRMTPAQRRAERRREARLRQRAAAAHHQVPAEPASQVGRWDPPFTVTTNYRGYGIHAALLHTGKVLFWGYPIHRASNGFASKGNVTYAWLWDPAKGTDMNVAVEDVTPVVDGEIPSIYCSGMSFLADGRLLVVGGNLTWPDQMPGYTEFAGLNLGLIFDPDTEEWTELERPAGFRGRWYPSQVLLGDGRTFVISGLTDEAPGGVLNEDLELYEPPSADDALGTFRLFSSNSQRRNTDLYPHLFTMPNGKVLMTGPDEPDNALLDPAALANPAANPWTELDRQNVERIGGNAVLEPEGPAGSSKVLQIAGQPNGQAPHASTERLDIDAATPTWTAGPTLNYGRSYPNTVLLPDRALATIGGGLTPYSSDGRRMELLAPGASSWTLGPKQDEDRAYHSTALLLPDGRVMSGGDDLSPTTDPNGGRQGSSPDDTVEIYSPPYLFKGTRPAITSGASQLAWNEPFSVGYTVAAGRTFSSAVLVAPGASTHGNDMNQRLVPLAVTGDASNVLSLVAPPNPNVAPPGRYMLFVLDSQGVPSIARWVQLGPRASIEVEGTHAPGSQLTLRSAQPLFAGPGARQESWDVDNDGAYDDHIGATTTKTFAQPGSYRVGLRVTTGFLVTETSHTVVVPNTPPVASFDFAPAAPLTGDPVTLTSNSSDAESGVTVAWDRDGDGAYEVNGPVATVTFGSAGSYPVRLRVRDAHGGETIATRTIVVGRSGSDPDPPPPPPPSTEPDPTEPDPTEPDPTEPDPEPQPDPTPQPGPEPDPEPGETPITEPGLPDFSGPALQLGFAERTWLSRLRRDGRLRVSVMVDEPARVELAFFRGRRRVGRVRADLPASRTRTLVIRPRRDTLAWIRRASAPRLRFSAVAVDEARNDTAWTRVLRPADRRGR